jgi:hypothetical protein
VAQVTEKELQEAVLALANLKKWLVYHTYDSRRSNPGFPDLVMVKDHRLLFVELKTKTGRVSTAQTQWLDALRAVSNHWSIVGGKTFGKVEVYLWRPSDWHDGTIEEVLW